MGDLPFPSWGSLIQNAPTMVIGMDWKEGIEFHAEMVSRDHAGADHLMKEINGLFTEWQSVVMEQPPQDVLPASCVCAQLGTVSPAMEKSSQAAIPEIGLRMVTDLAAHWRVQRRESTISVHTKAKISMSDLVKTFIDAVGQSQQP